MDREFCRSMIVNYVAVLKTVSCTTLDWLWTKLQDGNSWVTDQNNVVSNWLNQVTVFLNVNRLIGLVVKASASRAEGPGFKCHLRRDFFGVESYQWLKHWHSSGYPARRLAL